MWIRVREQPTDRRLFSVCAAASLAAVLIGGLSMLACWAATDFDPDTGRGLAKLGKLGVGILAAGVLMHYPRGPRWARANGCKPDASSPSTTR